MLTADYEYTYGEYGEVTKIKNNTENTEISYIDGKTQITLLNGEGEADDTVLYSTETNENGETVEFFGGMSYTQSNGTAVTDSTTGLTTSGSNLVTPCNSYIFGYESDYFGRQTEKTLTTNVRNENSISQDLNFETHYEYKNLGNDKTTALVSSYRTILNMVTKATDAETTTTDISTIRDWEYLYSYDSNGNIIDISVTFSDGDVEVENISICNYVYDEAGQLVRENNMFTEKSYTYVYDKGGNIAQKNEYSYSTEELGEAISTINYTYDSVWKDKLTAYGETAIATDSIGNPLNMVSKTFFGGANSATLEWNGRQLSSATVDGTKYEYTYDSSGLRTRMVIYNKNQPTVSAIYYYIWQNGKMLGYCITDANGVIEHTVKMLFDNNGDTVGYELYAAEDNSTKAYFFHKNLQGDITDVFNENGETVISYYYDSWGNITLNLNSSDRDHLTESTGVALFTPITYRGYCYDYYTGLYYLQSRYYNPTYGRFLNADSTDILEATQGTTHGANLFAYCNNNPVNYVDYTGGFSTLIIGGGAIAFLTLLKSLVESVLLVLILLMVVIIVVDPALWERISDATIKIGDEIKTGIIGLIEMIMHIYRLVESDLCTVIDDIIFRAKNNPYDPKQQKHHIAPQKITFTGQLCSYYVVEKSNININDPINTIMLDASFHRALNTNLYYSLIYNSTKYAFEMSGSEGVWFTLAFYNGLLAVLNEYCGEVW